LSSLARAQAMKSLTLLAGTLGCTTSMLGTLAPRAMASKSRSRLNLTLEYSVWLMVLVTATNSSV